GRRDSMASRLAEVDAGVALCARDRRRTPLRDADRNRRGWRLPDLDVQVRPDARRPSRNARLAHASQPDRPGEGHGPAVTRSRWPFAFGSPVQAEAALEGGKAGMRAVLPASTA